jgi:Spy/CpxP family protein refolding chaperone
MRDIKVAAWPHQGSMKLWRLLAFGVLAAAAASLTLPALAQGHPGHHGPGMGAGPGGGMMMLGGSPEHVARAVDRMLDGLNATDAQRAQIKQIATSAAADMKAQHDAGRDLHERGLQIFTAPVVDANAAEALRQQMTAHHDQASKRMLQAMLDVARVLTPEQRAKLGERMKERQARMKDRMQRMQREHSPRGQQQPPAPK